MVKNKCHVLTEHEMTTRKQIKTNVIWQADTEKWLTQKSHVYYHDQCTFKENDIFFLKIATPQRFKKINRIRFKNFY